MHSVANGGEEAFFSGVQEIVQQRRLQTARNNDIRPVLTSCTTNTTRHKTRLVD